MNTETPSSLLALHGGQPVRTTPWPRRHLLTEAEKAAVVRLFDEAIATGNAIGYAGPEEAAYCKAFCEWMGGGFADAVNSGTSALYVALAALELPPGSEVIVPPITDAGGVMPVALLGLTPVYADSEPGRFHIGVEEIRAKLTPRTRAIIVMHAAGIPAEMDGILALAAEHRLYVVEDCAQAHGATHRGRPVGTLGAVAAFSTMFGKTHCTGGQGGVVYTQDAALYAKVRQYSDRGKAFGHPVGTRNVVAALNLNADELHCAIGRVQIARLPGFMQRRREIARFVRDACAARLRGVSMADGGPEADPVHWFLIFRYDSALYTVSKEEFVEALVKEGVPFEANYDYVPSEYPWACGGGAASIPLPNARAAIAGHFRLIIHENLAPCDVEEIVAALEKVESVFLK